jgi:Gly-Xaa carboxypeptidase
MSQNRVNYTLIPQGEETPLTPPKPSRWNRRLWLWAAAGILVVAVIVTVALTTIASHKHDGFPDSNLPACPQYPALKSTSSERRKLEKEVREELSSDTFFDKSLKKLQGAVQIPTESFDDMGKVGEDPRWDIFVDFHKYLKEAFPLV